MIEGKKHPIVNTLAYCHMVRQARELHPMRDRLIIELSKKLNIRPEEYVQVPTTPEPKDIQPYRSGLKGVNRPKAQ